MDKEAKVAALKEVIQEYTNQIRELEADRAAVERALRRLASNGGQIEFDEFSSTTQLETIGPTEAVRACFDSKPNKRWRARELRDRLESLRDNGKLLTDAKDLLTTVHWILMDLVNNKKYIVKHGKGHTAWYNKKM